MKTSFSVFGLSVLFFSLSSMASPEIESIQWEGLRQMFCKSENFNVTIWKKGSGFEVYAGDDSNQQLPKLLLYRVPTNMEISQIFPPEAYFREASGKLVVKAHAKGRVVTLNYTEGGKEHSVLVGNCEYEIAE